MRNSKATDFSGGYGPHCDRLFSKKTGDTMADDDLNEKIQSERDDALAVLNDVTEQARYKSLGDGRIRSPEKSRIRLKYLRLIIQAQGGTPEDSTR